MEIREGGEAVGARGARGAVGSKGKRMRGVGECWKKGRRTEGSKSRCSHSALPDVEESNMPLEMKSRIEGIISKMVPSSM